MDPKASEATAITSRMIPYRTITERPQPFSMLVTRSAVINGIMHSRTTSKATASGVITAGSRYPLRLFKSFLYIDSPGCMM